MIQRHKTITLTPYHPTNGGMNRYKNFPSGRRVILSNDNRFTPIVTGEDRNTWEPMYGITSPTTDGTKNGVPGVFGESFNVEEIPHQIITNGVVELPTDKYLAAPDAASRTWLPGEILVIVPNRTGGWLIGILSPVASASPEYKNTHQQIGVLLKPLTWKSEGGTIKPVQPTLEILVGYNKIPKMMIVPGAGKAAPLATPKVAAK